MLSASKRERSLGEGRVVASHAVTSSAAVRFTPAYGLGSECAILPRLIVTVPVWPWVQESGPQLGVPGHGARLTNEPGRVSPFCMSDCCSQGCQPQAHLALAVILARKYCEATLARSVPH